MWNNTLKKTMAFLLVIVLSTLFPVEMYGYSFSVTRKESPRDFSLFLASCSIEERIQLMQSLQDLPKIKKEYFGVLKGLAPLSSYAENSKQVTDKRPMRPRTFNEVSPSTVRDAVLRGILKYEETYSVEGIKKALVYRSHNKLTYPFRSVDEVDYHSIAQWIARENGISKKQAQTLPTFALERTVVENFFAKLWDKLTVQQKRELLDKIEKDTGTIPNKAVILSMSGAAAITALSTSVALAGFKFYVMMSVFIKTVAGFFGIVLSFGVYTTASSLVALLSGPIGWTIAAVLATAGVVLYASAEEDIIANFVMTVHLIKANKWQSQL